ncbi:hypothetical protein IAT38_008136 [Cryptococcus sp. DSM 104549]
MGFWKKLKSLGSGKGASTTDKRRKPAGHHATAAAIDNSSAGDEEPPPWSDMPTCEENLLISTAPASRHTPSCTSQRLPSRPSSPVPISAAPTANNIDPYLPSLLPVHDDILHFLCLVRPTLTAQLSSYYHTYSTPLLYRHLRVNPRFANTLPFLLPSPDSTSSSTSRVLTNLTHTETLEFRCPDDILMFTRLHRPVFPSLRRIVLAWVTDPPHRAPTSTAPPIVTSALHTLMLQTSPTPPQRASGRLLPSLVFRLSRELHLDGARAEVTQWLTPLRPPIASVILTPERQASVAYRGLILGIPIIWPGAKVLRIVFEPVPPPRLGERVGATEARIAAHVAASYSAYELWVRSGDGARKKAGKVARVEYYVADAEGVRRRVEEDLWGGRIEADVDWRWEREEERAMLNYMAACCVFVNYDQDNVASTYAVCDGDELCYGGADRLLVTTTSIRVKPSSDGEGTK